MLQKMRGDLFSYKYIIHLMEGDILILTKWLKLK